MTPPRWLPTLTRAQCWDGVGRLDPAAAMDQWECLRETISAHVAPVTVISTGPWARSATFVRDVGHPLEDGSVLMLRPAGIRGLIETVRMKTALAHVGVEVRCPGEDMPIDGGNVLADAHGRLLVGFVGETTPELLAVVARLKEITGRSALGVPLAGGRWPHVDMAIADLGGRGWLVHPTALAGFDAMDPSWQGLLDGLPAIVVEPEEGDRLACNVLVAAQTVIGPPISASTRARVEALDLEWIPVEVDQIRKAGGGVHCLTLDIA